MASRFIQTFGGSVGIILAQAICRDTFGGPKLGKFYSSIGSALAIFPAIDLVAGRFIAERFGWSNMLLFLCCFAIVLIFLVGAKLPETHHKDNRKFVPVAHIAYQLIRDKKPSALVWLWQPVTVSLLVILLKGHLIWLRYWVYRRVNMDRPSFPLPLLQWWGGCSLKSFTASIPPKVLWAMVFGSSLFLAHYWTVLLLSITPWCPQSHDDRGNHHKPNGDSFWNLHSGNQYISFGPDEL